MFLRVTKRAWLTLGFVLGAGALLTFVANPALLNINKPIKPPLSAEILAQLSTSTSGNFGSYASGGFTSSVVSQASNASVMSNASQASNASASTASSTSSSNCTCEGKWNMSATLNWTGVIDWDLHLAIQRADGQPAQQIYYGNMTGNGFSLDHDSHPSCSATPTPPETLTGSGPCGIYTVYKNLYNACGVSGGGTTSASQWTSDGGQSMSNASQATSPSGSTSTEPGSPALTITNAQSTNAGIIVTQTDYTVSVSCEADCGNGTVDSGEECDDGNTSDNDSCSSTCRIPAQAVCGNGNVDNGEECDDGNQVNTDACSNTCKNPVCGNGTKEQGEECDDGNQVNTDACSTTCKNPVCGNGVKQQGESCDDGNQTQDDGCSNGCKFECEDGRDNDGDGTVDNGDAYCFTPFNQQLLPPDEHVDSPGDDSTDTAAPEDDDDEQVSFLERFFGRVWGMLTGQVQQPQPELVAQAGPVFNPANEEFGACDNPQPIINPDNGLIMQPIANPIAGGDPHANIMNCWAAGGVSWANNCIHACNCPSGSSFLNGACVADSCTGACSQELNAVNCTSCCLSNDDVPEPEPEPAPPTDGSCVPARFVFIEATNMPGTDGSVMEYQAGDPMPPTEQIHLNGNGEHNLGVFNQEEGPFHCYVSGGMAWAASCGPHCQCPTGNAVFDAPCNDPATAAEIADMENNPPEQDPEDTTCNSCTVACQETAPVVASSASSVPQNNYCCMSGACSLTTNGLCSDGSAAMPKLTCDNTCVAISSSRSSVSSSASSVSSSVSSHSSSRSSQSSSVISAPAVCGNGVQEYGEACDAGAANADTPAATCRADCTLPYCGDGIIATGQPSYALAEQCDCGPGFTYDPNNIHGQYCNTEVNGEPAVCNVGNCQVYYCGDGFGFNNGLDLDVGTLDDEMCDLGDENIAIDAPATGLGELGYACRMNCKQARCGDGIVDTGLGEQCDIGGQCADGSSCDCANQAWGDALGLCCNDGSRCAVRGTNTCTYDCKIQANFNGATAGTTAGAGAVASSSRSSAPGVGGVACADDLDCHPTCSACSNITGFGCGKQCTGMLCVEGRCSNTPTNIACAPSSCLVNTNGGTTAGATSGNTSGNTSGTTSGTTSGNTSGTTSGTTSGNTSGTTSGTTSGGGGSSGRSSSRSSASTGVQCTTNNQCPGTQQCIGGTCVECANDTQCSAGQRCVNNRCTNDCTSDDQCLSGQQCINNTCTTSTTSSASRGSLADTCFMNECETGGLQYCQSNGFTGCNQLSTAPCIQCTNGNGTGPQGEGGSCTSNAQCSSGVCQNGQCTCSTSAQCTGAQSCINNVCTDTSCTSNAQCPSGLCLNGQCTSCTNGNQCDSGICLPGGICSECTSDAQCPGGQRCVGNVCTERAECLADAECPSGLCVNGQCQECTYDEQCSTNRCEQGRCSACTSNSQCTLDLCLPGGICAQCTNDTHCQAGERCVGNMCLNSARIAALPLFCGNGRIDAGESCDSGSGNSDAPNALCRTDCQTARCGDGIQDVPLESCDDGNTAQGDGCSTLCQLERTASETLPGTVVELPFTPDNSNGEIVYQPWDTGSAGGDSAGGGTNSGDGSGVAYPPATSDTGPATVAIMAAGAAAGYAFIRRKKI